tara:strand:- start:447 stop:818 length:372 start_codon:yes stop_codon:yes gene_type:complete
LLPLDCVSIRVLEGIYDARSGLNESAMLNARRDRIAITGFVELCHATDGEFNLTFDNRPPLSAVRMRGKFNIFQESEKGHETIIELHHRSLHNIVGKRHINTWKHFDEIWIGHVWLSFARWGQ